MCLNDLMLLQVIKGIVDGCQQSDCALLGGEVCSFFSPYPNRQELAGGRHASAFLCTCCTV